jgi:hypothetical protein
MGIHLNRGHTLAARESRRKHAVDAILEPTDGPLTR